MSNIAIQKLAMTEDRSLPVLREAEEFMCQIRERAFNLAMNRGRRRADPLQDWLAAEREFHLPASRLVERDKTFSFCVSLPGFESAEVAVTATPNELIVRAKHARAEKTESEEHVIWSEFRSNDVCRRFELPKDIDVERASASLKNGMLKVVVPKRDQIN